MNTSRLLSLFLVLLAVFVFVVAMFFFFGKKQTKTEEGEKTATEEGRAAADTAKVLNVVTYLSNDRVNQMKSTLGDSYLFDARSKANSYDFNGVTVSVVSGDLTDYPGYTKYTHTFPKPFKGEKVVFDGEASNHFFEDPVTRLTTYFWFNSLLFLTFTTQKEGEQSVTKYYHYSGHPSQNALRWERFDRDPTSPLQLGVLAPKLDELNTAAGNVVALTLDEYVEESAGTYTTLLDTVTTTFSLAKRSSSQTGFVKVTHKLSVAAEGQARPFKLRKVTVSGTELSDLALTKSPVVSVAVFWWYNVPLLAELELHGGDREHLAYNVDTNNWEGEVVEKLRAKLFVLKNKLGDPLTLDLSKVVTEDQTYTSNGVLVRVSPGATSASQVFTKFTHRFTSGTAHFVGSFVNAGTSQVGLPVVRLNEASAYYYRGVPLLLKLNLATAGSLTNKHRYYSNNGFGVWKLVVLDDQLPNTEALLNKLAEDNRKMVAENDKYVLDARMRSNYLSQGKLVNVAKQAMENLQGFNVFNHTVTANQSFKFEKFTVAGKDVAASAEETLSGADYAKVYWYLDDPLLLNLHGRTVTAPGEGAEPATVQYDHFYSFNAETKEWKKVEDDVDGDESLKKVLTTARSKLGSVTLNLGNTAGEYKSGHVTVTVTDATPFDNDPPTSFTKRVHTLSVPFPVDRVKHFDFNLQLAKVDGSHYHWAVPVDEPLVAPELVVTRVEVYYSGDVPLHMAVYSAHGAPVRYSNSFRGTLWQKDDYSNKASLKDVLLALRSNLRSTARLDVCKGVSSDKEVTFELKYHGAQKSVLVTSTTSEPDETGVAKVTHKLPDGVTLKFTSITCNDNLLTATTMDEVNAVFTYRKNGAPLFLKTNSDPKYYVMSGDGGMSVFLPEKGETFDDAALSKKVAELSKKVGKVFNVDVLKKEKYTLDETNFKVVKTEAFGFTKVMHVLDVESAPGTAPAPFTVRGFHEGDREAVVFQTGLMVSWFAVYYTGERLLYLQVKAHGDNGKFYHYVRDEGLWLLDGIHERFENDELNERLDYLKDGLGNEFSLDLAEDVDNPLFRVDTVASDLVPGYVKHTYKPFGMEFPLLLKNLTLGNVNVSLPLADRHLTLLTAYSFRKNFLFFHAVTHDNKDLFFKTNFDGSFVPLKFDNFGDEALKAELSHLRLAVVNQFSLELSKKDSYAYHNLAVNVVKQTQVVFEGYDKYLHDLVDGDTSVPFKLVSVKDNGSVTNVPVFSELVYFAYVYLHNDTPLLLELHSSTKERSDYHYYYFANNLGNWELLENPTLGQLGTTKVKEVLNTARDKLAQTFKVDLSRKFSYMFFNGAERNFFLNVTVGEDPRENFGFSVYSHVFMLQKALNATGDPRAPTSSNLGGTTVLPHPPAAPVANPENAQQAAGADAAPKAAVPTTDPPVSATSAVSPVVPPDTTPVKDPVVAVLSTYQTLKADVLRGVNLMGANLPVVGKFALGNVDQVGFAVDSLLKLNVFWWHDKYPALVHLFNGVDNKYYKRLGNKWVLAKKVERPLSRAALVPLLKDVKANLAVPVEVDLDKSSDYDQYVKYVSEGLTLRVVPSYNFVEGFKGFTHFSATNYERAFRVNRLSLWGDVVTTDLPNGFVKSATVFTDADLLPLAVELEWTKLNNASFLNKYKYFKNDGHRGWVVHATDNAAVRLVDDVMLAFLKDVKQTLGERVVLALEKRENYKLTNAENAPTVTVTKDPTTHSNAWNGYHKVTHTLPTNNARVVMLKMGERVLRTLHPQTNVKVVDTFWFKNVLLLVKVTLAGAPASGATTSGADTFLYFKNDHKEDLMLVDAPTGELLLDEPSDVLVELAAKFKDYLQLDVAERTLKNDVDMVKLLPALYVVDTFVPEGFARYNLYVLDQRAGVKLGKLLYHGRDFSTGNFTLPELNVYSVYVFTPVGHFSPFFLELHVRGPNQLGLYYYHLNQYGDWVKLETGERRLTHNELYNKLSVLAEKLGNVTVVDLSKTEGFYYGLNMTDVTKYEFPGVRGYAKYLHKAHDLQNFTVAKFVNKGVVLPNLPVLKVSHVSVYTTHGNKPLLLELKVGGRYKFFSSNSNGMWFEERLPSGDLKSALDRVYDEHKQVARHTKDMVSLHLNTDFVRDYVLTEGTVDDYDGAVAVPAEEPALEPAPPAERLLPEDPESREAEPSVPNPVLTGTGRTTEPPAESVTRTHVLNPVLYVEPDKLSYSYVSHGKTVFVNRRDDHFRGYNVTVHKLEDNQPFTLRRVVFLGRDFDLGLGEVKLLSATLFSFLHTPLVLKVVFLDGTEKFFSFDFLTQTWAGLEVGDLEEKLDEMKYQQSKFVVLDVGKHAEYTVNDNKFVVLKSAVGKFTRLTTRLKVAEEAFQAKKLKVVRMKKERVKEKAEFKDAADRQKVFFDAAKQQVDKDKQDFDKLLEEWKKKDAFRTSNFKKYMELLEQYEKLKKELEDLEDKRDDSETGLQALTKKRDELYNKGKELDTVAPTNAEGQHKATELKGKLDALVEASKTLLGLAGLTGNAEPLSHLPKLDKAVEMVGLLKEVTDFVNHLPAQVENKAGYEKVRALVDMAKERAVAVDKFNEAVEAAKKVPEAVSEANKLVSAFGFAKDLKTAVEAVEKLTEAETPELDKATEAMKKLKKAFEPVKGLNELKDGFKDLRDLVEWSPKVRVYIEFKGRLKEMLNEATTNEETSKTRQDVLDFLDEYRALPLLAEKLRTFGDASLTADALKPLLDGLKAVWGLLKTGYKVNAEAAFSHLEKLKLGEQAPAKLDEAAKFANDLKAAVEAVEGFDDNLPLDKQTEAFTAVKKVKDALAGVGKLKDAAELVQKVETVVGLNDLFVTVTKVNELKPKLDAVETTVDNTTQAPKLKDAVVAVKAAKDNLKVHEKVPNVKKALSTSLETMKGKLNDVLKLGVEGAWKVYKAALVELARQERRLKDYNLRYERFSTDVEFSDDDDDDDGPEAAELLFGLGGLRNLGKDLVVAGLPLGTHLNTLNAYFTEGFAQPLLLQFKYNLGEDVDEPVNEGMSRPPTADALQLGDRVTPAQVTGNAAQTPASAVVTPAVEKVSELLSVGLNQTTPRVLPEDGTVLTATGDQNDAPVAPPNEAGRTEPVAPEPAERGPGGAPQGPPGPPPARDQVVYPGRFFYWDTDRTWRAFVPQGSGALSRKLEELKAKHAPTFDLNLAKAPGSRRKENYVLKTETFTVKRVLYSSAYKMTKEGDTSRLQGTPEQAAGPHVFNLADYDSSVHFFPPFNHRWLVHHKPPKVENGKVVDQLPAFALDRLNVNGVPLELGADAAGALGTVNSVSALLNPYGTPVLVFLYKPVVQASTTRHNYVVYVLREGRYVVDESFGNFSALLFKLEHTLYEWSSDSTFGDFRNMVLDKVAKLRAEMNFSYVVDLDATAHYLKEGVVVNVDTAEAFGVKHVSYTPGVVPVQGVELPTVVPAFVVQKVFAGDTVFKGFELPFKNVLHVTVFHADALHLLKPDVAKEFAKFPLLVEFSVRNEFNRLEHFYYNFVGGDRFEFFSKTKVRLTASEVADVTKLVAYRNLRAAKTLAAPLELDFSLKFTHYTPEYKVLVEKLFKKAAVPPKTGTAEAAPADLNAFVPDGYVLFKYTVHKNSPAFTAGRLFFDGFWTFALKKFTYTDYFVYVKQGDLLPVLVAMSYTEGSAATPKYDWLGLEGGNPVALFANETVSPLLEADKAKVEAQLKRLTANVDLYLDPPVPAWGAVAQGQTVKLSPVGGVTGFPVVPGKPKGPEVPGSGSQAPQTPAVPANPPVGGPSVPVGGAPAPGARGKAPEQVPVPTAPKDPAERAPQAPGDSGPGGEKPLNPVQGAAGSDNTGNQGGATNNQNQASG